MKKLIIFVFILAISTIFIGCNNGGDYAESGTNNSKNRQSDESKEIITLIEDFGKNLKKVSLQAPKEILHLSIQENYSDYVSPSLLSEWQKDTRNIPGRMTSSPWPERIEVLNINKVSELVYKAECEIIEITSVEMKNGGVAARRPIEITVEKVESRWLITSVNLGKYEDNNIVQYRNNLYGFSISLPEDWKDYSIITDNWEGLKDGNNIAAGPLLSIRHPKWSQQEPRQDIPIMVLTLSQWNSLRQEEFHIGAAPVGPKELARNKSYVFALPARYNYAFPAGYEEVEKILNNNSFQAFDLN